MKKKSAEPEQGIFQTIASVEDMVPIAKDIVAQYCLENDVDEKDIYPTVWVDILSELQIKLFAPNRKILKLDGSTYNEYDQEKVNYVYEYIYKRLCNLHCQEISLKGFIDMVGISKQTFYNWIDGSSEAGLRASRIDLHEKIMADNEESLFNLMKDRRNNPMKYLPKLNKVHHWNMPGVGKERTNTQALERQELPRLSEKNCVDLRNNLISSNE